MRRKDSGNYIVYYTSQRRIINSGYAVYMGVSSDKKDLYEFTINGKFVYLKLKDILMYDGVIDKKPVGAVQASLKSRAS